MLALDDLQKDLLEREIRAFIKEVADPEAQSRYAAFLQAVENGEVGEEHTRLLAGLLEVVLESGRARKLYGPAGENSLISLFQKTPQGSALTQQANNVNQALKGIEEQVIKKMSFRPSRPGSWVLTLQTDRCELTLRIDRREIRVDNLGIDLA
jgi:hypothetical protein